MDEPHDQRRLCFHARRCHTKVPERDEEARGVAASTSVCSASNVLNCTLVISTLAESLSIAAFVEATSAKRVLCHFCVFFQIPAVSDVMHEGARNRDVPHNQLGTQTQKLPFDCSLLMKKRLITQSPSGWWGSDHVAELASSVRDHKKHP